MIRKTPSFFRLIQVDYPSVIAISFPVMLWILFLILYIVGLFLGKPALGMLTQISLVSGLFYGGFLLSLFTAPILIFRYRLFRGIFAEGEEVQGVIHGVGFFRDRGTIELSYTYNGQEYLSRSAVQKMDQTEKLKPGKTVDIMIDRTKPSRAFLKDLYL